MRATGKVAFRKQDTRADWVWVRVSDNPDAPKTIRGCLPARLNVIFKLRNHLEVWRLAHVMLLQGVNGNFAPRGPETMSRVQLRNENVCHRTVHTRDILGMVHLIPIGSDRFLVNDRIDLTTWYELS